MRRAWIGAIGLLACAGGARAEGLDPRQEAEIHRQKAMKWIESKDWDHVRGEASEAVRLDPSDADSWLLLGTAEQRLEHRTEAIAAFRKYLSLNPPPDKAQEVRLRIADLEVTTEQQKNASDTEARERYTDPMGGGVSFGYSPVYAIGSRSATDLNTSISSSFALDFTVARVLSFGFRYASGTVPSLIETETLSGQTTNTPYSNLNNHIYEFELSAGIPVLDPYARIGPFEVLVPIYMGIPLDFVSVGKGSFMTAGLDFATGVSARWYTKTILVPQITAMYHFYNPQTSFGMFNPPSGDFSTADNTKFAIQNPASGQEIKGPLTGFELRLTLNLVFGGRNKEQQEADDDLAHRLDQVGN